MVTDTIKTIDSNSPQNKNFIFDINIRKDTKKNGSYFFSKDQFYIIIQWWFEMDFRKTFVLFSKQRPVSTDSLGKHPSINYST